MSVRTLPTGAVLSQQEVATLFGISRERAQQIEKRALAKLRRGLIREAESQGLTVQEMFSLADFKEARRN